MEGKLNNNNIEFKFIRNQYPLSEKLFCYFQSSNLSQWQPECGDWVGLVKAGFNNLKECKIRKMIQNEWLESRKKVNVDYSHVVFEQNELTTELDGIYQFVYVTKNDLVRGVSKPFQFERVLSHVEAKRMVEIMGKQEILGRHQEILGRHQEVLGKQEILGRHQEIMGRHQEIMGKPEIMGKQEIMGRNQEIMGKHEIDCQLKGTETENFMARVEHDLIKECQRLNLNWGKITDDAVSGKLIQKYLNNMKSSVHKDDEVTRRVEDLFVENGKLCLSLKAKIVEIAGLKKECEDMKSINGDLLNRLTIAERKVEQLEREREFNLKRIEELSIKETSRVCLEKNYAGKQQQQQQGIQHLITELDETNWFLQEQKPELTRIGGSFYTELETPIESRVKFVQRFEEPTTTQKVGASLIEKILREVEGTPSQDVMLLKRVIEELKNDNEYLKDRVRRIEGECLRPETHLTSLGSTIGKDVLPRLSLGPMELVGLRGTEKQQLHSLPVVGQSTMNVHQEMPTTRPPVTIVGKQVEQVQQKQQLLQHQQLFLQQQQQQIQQVKQQHIVEQGQHQPIQQVKQQHIVEQGQHQPIQQVKQQHVVEQGQQQLHQQLTRGQVGEYLNKLDDEIRTKIEERLRNKLQEQIKGKLDEITSRVAVVNKLSGQQQQQQPTQWSMHVTEELLPSQKWRLDEQTRKIKEQLTQKPCGLTSSSSTTTTTTATWTTMCPVCGVVMPTELNACDFEIHVNSHFTD